VGGVGGNEEAGMSDPITSEPFGRADSTESTSNPGHQPAGAPSDTPWSIPQGQRPRPPRRRLASIVVCLALLAAGAFLGVAIAHGFWLSHDRAVAQAPSGPGVNGFSFGSGGPASGGSSGSPFFGGGSGGSSGSPFFGGSGSRGSGGSTSSATGGPSDVRAIAAKVEPALVDVNLTEADGSAAEATGIVLTPSGLVLTNNHVVDGAATIKATDLGNGRTYSATVLGYDQSADVGLIQLQGASGLAAATLGDSAAVTVGQPVVAIGNAGGVGGTPSAAGGKVVALDRQITASDAGDGTSEQLSGLIETNADIEPGDSGGPLVNSSGQVLAMDTAASGGFSFGSLSSGQDQGFAVPIDTATAIVSQIQSGQASAAVHIGPTAFLGVEVETSAAQGGFGFGGSSSSGAPIVGVLSGSPAAQAGLVAGDTIVTVDGQSVTSPGTLTTLVGSDRPGGKVEIGWVDQAGDRHTSTVTLASGPAH
jgi:S1-C subfamily serine protease